jgi:nucleotide-binding universal stress UspA family protein
VAGDLRVLAWITEAGWEACVDAVKQLPAGDVTLLHVAAHDLPGPRGPRHERVMERMNALAEQASQALLEDAEERLGLAADKRSETGEAHTIVMDAANAADILVLARESRHPGPHSIGHDSRFVVDHAPCTVIVVWPAGAPDSAPPKPKPKPKGKPKPKPKPEPGHW